MSTINSSENIPANENLDNNVDNQDVSQINPSEPLLPRLAWNSQVAFFRAMFRAKKALDNIDREFDTIKK